MNAGRQRTMSAVGAGCLLALLLAVAPVAARAFTGSAAARWLALGALLALAAGPVSRPRRRPSPVLVVHRPRRPRGEP